MLIDIYVTTRASTKYARLRLLSFQIKLSCALQRWQQVRIVMGKKATELRAILFLLNSLYGTLRQTACETTNEYVLLGHGLDAWNPPTFRFRNETRSTFETVNETSRNSHTLCRRFYCRCTVQIMSPFIDSSAHGAIHRSLTSFLVGPCVDLSGFIDEEQPNPLPRYNSTLKVKF